METNFAYPVVFKNLGQQAQDAEGVLLRMSSCGHLSRTVEILNKLSEDDVAQMRSDIFDEILLNIVAKRDISCPLAAASAAYVLVNIAGMKISSSCFGMAISEFSRHLEIETMGSIIGSLLESRMISVSLQVNSAYDDALHFFTNV